MYLIFFFNDTATTEIYTLSLHDALPISGHFAKAGVDPAQHLVELRLDELGDMAPSVEIRADVFEPGEVVDVVRSEEHTSELQSRQYLVCRLLLEKKK